MKKISPITDLTIRSTEGAIAKVVMGLAYDCQRTIEETFVKALKTPCIPPLAWQDWGPEKEGAPIWWNDEPPQPIGSAPVLTLDVETNLVTGQLIGIGFSADDKNLYYTDTFEVPCIAELFKGKRFIGHNLKFDLHVLRQHGIPVTDDQIYWDTYLGSATEDPTKPSHGLKALCETELGIKWPTYEEMTKRKVTVVNKKGKQTEKVVEFTLEEIQAQHPGEVARYNGMDLIGSYRLAVKQMSRIKGNRLTLFKTVELPIASLTREMKALGLKVDREGLKKKETEYATKEQELKAIVVAETGTPEFNPASPKQVLGFLKGRGHDLKSTGEEVLRPIVDKDPWIKSLLELRGVSKLLGTYVRPLLENSVTDGRIHTNFNQIARMASGAEKAIITGRFSSSDPINLQNQPPEMREFFIPEEGYAFVCADYSQIDLRSLAHLSGEPVYCGAFLSGEKVHQAIADQFKVEYKLGKIISLALAYNGGPGRLKQESDSWGYNLDYWMCKKYSDDFITKLSTLTAWKKEQYAKAKRLGGVWTLFGRWIPLPYPSKEEISDNDYCIQHWQNCVIAFQGQGGTADIVKGGMLRLRRLGLIPNAQVHDELLIEVPAAEAQDVANRVKYELEHVTTLRVPLIAETKVGLTWAQAKP
jgi:DNA polymerase-1